MTRHRIHQRGSATVEMMLLTAMLIALAMLAVVAHRVIAAEQSTTSAAHAAARAATLQRSPQHAHSAGQSAATQTLRGHDLTCTRHDLRLDTGGLQPGSTVRARLTCHTSLQGLTGLDIPASYVAHGQSTSVVDLYRTTP